MFGSYFEAGYAALIDIEFYRLSYKLHSVFLIYSKQH
jgi:hypothetical protein